jgi:hypothetical protein
LVAGIINVVAALPVAAQYLFQPVQDLGTGYGTVAAVTGLSSEGVAVGYIKPDAASSITQAYRTTSTGLTLLSALRSYATSAAYAVNFAGQVVGVSCSADGNACRAALWNDRAPLDLGYVGKGGGAFGISRQGVAVGSAVSALDHAQHATLWNGVVPTTLPKLPGETSSVAVSVDQDQFGLVNLVAGTTTIGTGASVDTRATQWTGSTVADLGIPHSVATVFGGYLGIGGYFTVPGKTSHHGFVWKNGVTTEYGTLGGANSRVTGFANYGVLGSADDAQGVQSAVFWDSTGTPMDLNTFVPVGTPHLSEAIAGDTYADIVAVSNDSSGRPVRAFLLHGGGPLPPLVPPNIAPASGLYPQQFPLTVTMSTPSPNTTIRYHTDGTPPSPYGPIYDAPFQLTASAIVTAFDTNSNTFPFGSAVTTAVYELVPTFAGQSVSLGGSTAAVGTLGVVSSGNGIDGLGNTYAGDLLGTSLTWDNTLFSIGSATHQAASNTSIGLPAGHYSNIKLLATAVRGNRPNQRFLVTYTDGSSSSLMLSLSDWATPQNFAGETIVRNLDYRITPDGTVSYGPYFLYGYSLPIDPNKTVKTLTLPPIPYVVVLAAAVTAQTVDTPQQVDLASAYNVVGIVDTGSVPPNGGLDASNDAYSSALLGRSLNWSGSSFTLGRSGVPDAVSSATVALPSVSAGVINLLATAVGNPQTGQPFAVIYTDGSSTTTQLSLSDWRTPRGFAQETIAATLPYRVNAGGAAQVGPYYLYGYSIVLDRSKTVRSLLLPSNRNVVLLAANLSSANAVLPMQQIPLAGLPTRPAISTEGEATTTGGLDGLGNAYSSKYIGESLIWNGIPFIVPAPNGVSRQVVTIPSPAAYSTLNVVAADTRGSRVSVALDITYTDGTITHVLQGMSDWSTPQGYPGESLALVMPGRLNASGAVLTKPTYLYGYSFQLDRTKQIKSITLQNTPYVTVLGATLTE